jgi:hypothetical protein
LRQPEYRVGIRRAQERAFKATGHDARAQGPLLDLLQEPELSLLVEAEGFGKTITGCDMVTARGEAILARTAGGGLRATRESGLRTTGTRFQTGI